MGWREYAVVDDAAATVCDISVAPATAWLSSLGQTGFTAYAGLLPVGRLQSGQTVLVSGAGGAVGSMAGQFARLMGAGREMTAASMPSSITEMETSPPNCRRLPPTASTCSSTTWAAGNWRPRLRT
jgi:hypothetical protein